MPDCGDTPPSRTCALSQPIRQLHRDNCVAEIALETQRCTNKMCFYGCDATCSLEMVDGSYTSHFSSNAYFGNNIGSEEANFTGNSKKLG